MTEAPSFTTRLRARMSGEVSADTLEAFRRAGSGVYDLLLETEARRATCASGAGDMDDATRLLALTTWNAFALQTLGDEFLDADYRADRGTVGYVPPITRDQAQRFYGEVEHWLGCATRAAADPHCVAPAALPAELPPFVELDPCPPEHLQAMLSAVAKLREHAEIAVADAERLAGTDAAQPKTLRGLLATAGNAADYARRLYGEGGVEQSLHERIERSVQEALGLFYLIGQLAARPDLVGRAALPASVTGQGERLPGPGEPGFDPWCMTDPDTREHWQRDRQARQAIDLLWSSDPSPRATLDMVAEVRAALKAGYIEYAVDRRGRRLGNYYCCPWSPIYVTRRPLTIAGRRLRTGQQFTVDVSAEEMLEGGTFKRDLLLGNFSPTDRVDYCDPRSGGHDD